METVENVQETVKPKNEHFKNARRLLMSVQSVPGWIERFLCNVHKVKRLKCLPAQHQTFPMWKELLEIPFLKTSHSANQID